MAKLIGKRKREVGLVVRSSKESDNLKNLSDILYNKSKK